MCVTSGSQIFDSHHENNLRPLFDIVYKNERAKKKRS